jgi:hypothetical protein
MGALVNALGMNPGDLRSQLQSGSSLSDIASAHGMSLSDLTSAVQTQLASKFANRIVSGVSQSTSTGTDPTTAANLALEPQPIVA